MFSCLSNRCHSVGLTLSTLLILAGLTSRLSARTPAAPVSARAPAAPVLDTSAETAPDSAEATESQQTLKSLEDRVRMLERKLEIKKPEEGKGKPEAAVAVASAAIVTAGKDGFGLASADRQSIIRLRYVQHVDGRVFFDDATHQIPNTLLLRRARPIFDGTVSKYYNFRFMPEFSGSPTVLDAYGELAFVPEARLRMGKFKTPFGLERLKSNTDMDLIEFSNATSLTPNYDMGLTLYGDIREGYFLYSIGIFNGSVDGALDNAGREVDVDDNKDLIGRVFFFPFKTSKEESLRDLGIGLAASFGHKLGNFADPEVPVYRTEGQRAFFNYRADAAVPASKGVAAVAGDTVRAWGDGYRVNPQGYVYVGPVGIFSEYVISAQQLSHGGAAFGLDKRSFSNQAWNVTMSWVPTGETPSFKGLKPRRSLSFTEPDAYGALELVLRASKINLDKNVFNGFADPNVSANEAFTWTGGINWYLSGSVKCSASYAWTKFKGGAAAGADRTQERVFFSRIQTSF